MAIDDNTSYELTGYQVKDLASKVRAKADSSSLASVATSGLYSDLTGKPTIPTVYNGTLTIQQNGTTVGTFTANQSTNTTVNLAGGVYADDPTTPANPDAWITNSDLNYGTLVKTGTWTNTTTLPNTGSVAHTTVDVASMGFSSKDDYIVVAVNQGGGSNDPFTSITVPDGYKSATSFRIELWNCHWSSGAIGSGTKIQWAVFRLN